VTDEANTEREIDPRLEKLLEEMEGGGEALPPDELDAMFRALEGRMQEAESKPTWWWRTRSTRARRLVAITTFVVVVALTALLAPSRGVDALSLPSVLATLAALSVLVVASLFVAVRPVHVPALPRWQLVGLVGLSIAATIIVAVSTGRPMELHGSLFAHASPCMYFGLLAGVPVFAVARLLDRGAILGPILAAAAAGLAGNVALALHCPLATPSHNVAGHASVAVLFVAGIAMVELVLRRRRSA
jgi:hypothetical protein